MVLRKFSLWAVSDGSKLFSFSYINHKRLNRYKHKTSSISL